MLRHATTTSELQVVVILLETSTIAEQFDAKQMDLFACQYLHFSLRMFTHRYFFEDVFSGLTTCLGSSTSIFLSCRRLGDSLKVSLRSSPDHIFVSPKLKHRSLTVAVWDDHLEQIHSDHRALMATFNGR